eukprot:TRINITY_DN8961_c0_g1_i1.p1 TRINITY_DN8961_c0_g1~~TRINITY_DN8961_c0_g1_i1.p1  ORF type:complete len:232 (+),score=40.23 TRINITY_DN8961_c0_g1_i1:83-778(+)
MALLVSLAVLFCSLQSLLAQEQQDLLALTSDDACTDSESCGLELMQLRSKKGSEVDAGDEEGYDNDVAEGDSSKPKCKNYDDMARWKFPGAQNFNNELSQCGLKCIGSEECASACMEQKGYTRPCAGCMGKLGGCSLKSCSAHCINKGCQSTYAGCFNGTETDKAKCTPHWMQHNCVTQKHDRVLSLTDECVNCIHNSTCGSPFERCSGLDLEATVHNERKHVFRWWLNKK